MTEPSSSDLKRRRRQLLRKLPPLDSVLRGSLIERYKRVDKSTLELEMVIDDPGAYTKPWNARRNFTLSDTGFLRYQQICSVRENQQFYENTAKPAVGPAK